MIRKLLSAGTYLSAGTVAQVALGFAGNVILLRALAPAEFGLFAVTLAELSIIAAILSLRLGVVVIRTPDAEFSAALQRRYFTAMVAEVAIIASVSILWLIVTGRTAWTDAILVAAIALQALAVHMRSFWERSMPYRQIAISETAVVAVAQVVGVTVVLATGSPAALYLRELAAAVALLCMLHIMGGLRLMRFAWPRLHEWRQMIREASTVWLDSVLEGVFQRLTVIAAAALAGDHGAGLFSMAQRLAVLPHQIIQPFGRVAATWFSRAEAFGRQRLGRNRLIAAVLLPLAASALAAVLWADPLVPYVFGDHWRDTVPILKALSGAILFMTVFEITRGYAIAVRHIAALLGGRLAQFTAFGLGAASGWLTQDAPLVHLAAGLSLAFAAAFALQLALTRGGPT